MRMRNVKSNLNQVTCGLMRLPTDSFIDSEKREVKVDGPISLLVLAPKKK